MPEQDWGVYATLGGAPDRWRLHYPNTPLHDTYWPTIEAANAAVEAYTSENTEPWRVP